MICNCVSRERKSVRYDLTWESGILGSPSLSSGLFAAHHARSSSSSWGYRPFRPIFIFLGFRFLRFSSPDESIRVFISLIRFGIVSWYFLFIWRSGMTSPFRKLTRSVMLRLTSLSRWNAARALDRGPLGK